MIAPESESSLAEMEDRLFPALLFAEIVFPLFVLAETLIVLALFGLDPPLFPLPELELDPPLLPLLELDPPLLPLPDPELELEPDELEPDPPVYKVVPDDTFGVVTLLPN